MIFRQALLQTTAAVDIELYTSSIIQIIHEVA